MTIKSTNHLTHIATFCALLYSNSALCAELVEYDHTFLMGNDASNIDLSRYTEGNPTRPGIYDVSVYINDQPIMSQSIAFTVIEGKKNAQACITQKNLLQFHISSPDKNSGKAILLKRDDDLGDCLNLAEMISQSSIRYDVNDQRLDIDVPQAWIMKNYQNYVDPSLRENGINAAMLSYNLNGYHSESPGRTNDSIYAAFNGGINLGAWRLRASGNYNWMTNVHSDYDFQNRYLQRDLASLRSQLVIGESYTTGETFDSVSIRGIRLYSDSRMLPPVLASFAPIIHGVANTNAKVTVMQNGYKIYETTVPPGAFAIDDLSPSGYGSDLIVTIEETDGTKRTFSQPFSSVVQMLRPGVGRWDISAGQVLKDSIQDEPNLFQASYYYGLNNYLTGYTGIQLTDNNYTAGLLGLGMNTPVGAFSVDVTHSNVSIPDDKTYQGQSYRISWNKLFENTSTSLNIAAYRYSTQHYLGLNDALTLIDEVEHPEQDLEPKSMRNYSRMKNQVTVSINQPLKFEKKESPWGTLSGSASASSDNSRQFSLNTDGGFVLHSGGLTFSNDSFSDSDTLAVIQAPGAKGARINYGNSTVDRWSYGVTSALSPYHENRIALDINDLENDVELKSTSTVAIPRQGAVVFADFETVQGQSAIMNIVRSDGKNIPFAEDIYDEQNNIIGNVGQGGQAFVHGIEQEENIRIAWIEEGKPVSCFAHYQQNTASEKIAQSIILNGLRCQIQ
ncbi:outer membrane usher protein [Escherichia coli]|uniref:outer membrane usher protein n=1 Tax=Escherichia coli TaxID=562 RepID=UPI00069C0365|nr:outer membrane usher protein [Escherichia coli]EFB4085406.1 outer membrane usher protein [Escherichia coli O33]EFE7007731.1 outer membrane usher protein [Escherichia coli]EFG1125975.1 outer membrane usher protein [Escherichia coli]EFJ5618553.1 outer membrane usher protein [Escherichia coli]EFJ7020627.1 outer membrane usher protein [Escherichia coli]